jgi:hypothetical protein
MIGPETCNSISHFVVSSPDWSLVVSSSMVSSFAMEKTGLGLLTKVRTKVVLFFLQFDVKRNQWKKSKRFWKIRKT